MSNWPLIVQIIGFAAIAFEVGSYQPKHRKRILGFQLIGNLLWVVHFLLLSAPTGAVLNAVGAVRAYTFNRFGSHEGRSQWLLAIIVATIFAVSLLTWQGPISLLPMTGMSLATIGMWQRDEQRIRKIIFFSWPLWLIYNILVGSYAGVVNELLIAVSILIGLWRHRRPKSANI